MVGHELVEAVLAANQKLDAIVERVCGACEYSCCHTGTMVGSHGVRRLYKGMRLDREVAGRVRDGLDERAKELAADLDTIKQVTKMLRTSYAQEMAEELAEVEALTEDWRKFADFVASEFEPSPENLRRLIQFSAIRHNLLRQVREFPGAEAALANFCAPGGSFHFRGRKLAPPRCMFHTQGCLLGRYKPVKCANFFCSGDPNLLAECQSEMDFDEFVLANMYAESFEFVKRAIALENELGRDYWEPKIAFTSDPQQRAQLQELVRQRDGNVEIRQEPGSFFLSTQELLHLIREHGRDNTLVFCGASVGSPALYELAVALQQAHNDEMLGGFVLIAESFTPPSFMPHPMWSDRLMSQPLGSLDIYAVRED